MAAEQTESATRRGSAARAMIVEDARWAIDVVLSANRIRKLRGVLPFMVGHHLVRIAYEGSIALRLADTTVGIPSLAALIGDRFATITTRIRHTAKVLDNTSTGYYPMIADLESTQAEHSDKFTGNTYKWLRFLETDLGLYLFEDRVVGATVPAAHRLGFNYGSDGLSAQDLREVSEEWGGTLVVLAAATLDTTEPQPTIAFKPAQIELRDRLAAKYLDDRFDRDFTLGLKILLLMIEGDLNVSRLFLPVTAKGHEFAVFRAQAVTAYHSLSSLRLVSDMTQASTSNGITQLRAILNEAPARRLLSRGGKNVRNRCVHYPIQDPRVLPDPSKPMFGIIETVYPEVTWESYYHDVRITTDRLAETFANWKP